MCFSRITTHSWFLVLTIMRTVSAQDCQSETYQFERHYDPTYKLNLTTPADHVIASFQVSNTKSATSLNEYLAVKVTGDLLTFTTTKAFEEYEKTQQPLRITPYIEFRCSNGTLMGYYYQDLLEANNHAPEFSQAVYEATVPLPLPKNFDLTPFINEGHGVMAIDYDLLNNTVEFSFEPESQYLSVQSVKVPGDPKAFQATLRLKEQILKLPENIELDLIGTDQGVPARSGKAKLLIKPDLTIVYNDPPMFKRTFFQKEYQPEMEVSVIVELVPGTVHPEVEYGLMGDDAVYFELSVAEDKSKATVVMKTEKEPLKGKYFLSVVVQAKRSELLTAECVLLVDLKETQIDCARNITTIEKVLSIIHLEEEQEHAQVFPANIGECSYAILYQIPNNSVEIFSVDEAKGWIVSTMFDREDSILFKDVEIPQFQLVLQLRCPASVNPSLLSPTVFNQEITYSTDTTYLNIIVEDINDNAPIFAYPTEGEVFAFPVARITERLLPPQLLQAVAHDLDAGLNAAIKYTVTSNAEFDIDPKTGIVYPSMNALLDEIPVDVEIVATDRDGALDGNVSKLKIRVVPALYFQISLLQLNGVEQDQLDHLIGSIKISTGLRIVVLKSSYTSISSKRSSEKVLKLVVVAFDSQDNLMSTEDLSSSLQPFQDLKVAPLEDLLISDSTTDNDCRTYPYLVVMSVFIVLFVAACALAAYFWSKWHPTQGEPNLQQDPSTLSDDVLVENPHLNPGSTPPVEKRVVEGVTVDYSSDSISRSNRLARTLSELLIIDESQERSDTYDEISDDHQPKKSIKFNEEVERIEVF